jgi:Nucleotidyl transferase AbiEii toxin, Type IV TA system
MQVDIGFGDAVYPEPELASFPVLLPIEAPLIRAYPREATIAEKFHAMVVLDIRNSRMKDFYDIWFMANTWEFEMESLQKAIEFSFKRRGTSVLRTFLLRSQAVFWMTPKRKCNGMHSSTAWIPARSGQLSQRSVRFCAVFFCSALQKNHAKNQARTGIQHAIGIERAKRPSVLFQISISELPTMVDLRI